MHFITILNLSGVHSLAESYDDDLLPTPVVMRFTCTFLKNTQVKARVHITIRRFKN
jgi:hypothetical protein